MKKTFTYSFLFAVCFSSFASCTKDVKTPKVAGSTTARTTTTPTNTGTQTTDQHQGGGNGCGSSHGDYNSSGY